MSRSRVPTEILKNRKSRHAKGRTEPGNTGPLCTGAEGLATDEAKLFATLKSEAEKMRVLQSSDGLALRLLAVEYATCERLRRLLAKSGECYETPAGLIRRRPEVAMLRESQKAATRLLCEFGLTPASRSRAGQSTAPEETDKSYFFND